jgi:CheY-like chemotaxis protein
MDQGIAYDRGLWCPTVGGIWAAERNTSFIESVLSSETVLERAMFLGPALHESSSARSSRLAMTGRDGEDLLYGKSIALVDDDEAVLDAIQGLLEVFDVEVRIYQSGADFLQDNRKVACLIVDCNMPDLSGFDVISELRKRGIELPTIMITAIGDLAIERRAAEMGVKRVLAKPVKTPVLLTALRDAMR